MISVQKEKEEMITKINIEWDEEYKIYHGTASGEKDHILIEGDTIALIFADLIDAVHDVDVFRAERGEKRDEID